MSVHLVVRNTSTRRRLYRRDQLGRLANGVCREEGVTGDVELSLLLCDDDFIQGLNAQYRQTNRPTDVLAFAQGDSARGPVRVLGDIVISLETVERHCRGIRPAMRDEVRLLFCHGLLHLLNYDHATTEGRKGMMKKQAHYLGLSDAKAWPAQRPTRQVSQRRSAQ